MRNTAGFGVFAIFFCGVVISVGSVVSFVCLFVWLRRRWGVGAEGAGNSGKAAVRLVLLFVPLIYLLLSSREETNFPLHHRPSLACSRPPAPPRCPWPLPLSPFSRSFSSPCFILSFLFFLSFSLVFVYLFFFLYHTPFFPSPFF